MTLAHLCLGTASWNQVESYHGRVPPDDDELKRILDTAEAGGISWIDTARAYGNVEERLGKTDAGQRFHVSTKSKLKRIDGEYGDTATWLTIVESWSAIGQLDGDNFAAILMHLTPDLPPEEVSLWSNAFRDAVDSGLALRWGASVYTPEQADAVLFQEATVLQVPWSGWSVESPSAWKRIRDRAYADGILFFGRQPFGPRGEGLDAHVDAGFRRDALALALTTNPRGWCVVGVETAAQVTELLSWRDEMANA